MLFPGCLRFKSARVQKGIGVIAGTELVDNHLPRQMSALLTLGSLSYNAVYLGKQFPSFSQRPGLHACHLELRAGTRIRDTRVLWAQLERWSKALADASTKSAAKVMRADDLVFGDCDSGSVLSSLFLPALVPAGQSGQEGRCSCACDWSCGDRCYRTRPAC